MSYKIYSDGTLIYDIDVESLLLINPVLTLEDSMAGSLEFTMPPTHSHYDSIERLKSIITVERDGREIWEGRVLEERIDFYKRKKVTCEGELAYLNDTTQPQWEFHDIGVREFLTTLLSIHNSKVSSDKQFQTGIVTVTDPNDSLYRYTNRETTLNCIRDKLLDRLGGHFRVRKAGDIRYLDYLADSPRTCEQTIEFGKNLLDFSQNFDASDFVTAVIPLGARLDESEFTALESRVTIEEVNDGRDFIYSSAAVLEYGWIEQTVIWDDVHVPEILKRKAEQYLSAVQFEKLVLEVSAVDLHNLNTEIDNIEILDQVRVISTPHGLNRLFPVTRRSIPLAKPSEEKITFGSNIRVRLTNESRKENTTIIKEIEAIPTKQEFLESARQNATQLIHNALNGHVVITDDADELLIMDTDDIETATKVWRWNLNGLGYSSEGYDGSYNLAITMDGTILGDRIAAGTVSAAKLDVHYTGQVEQAIADAESNANVYTDTQISNSASSITLAAKSYTDSKLSSYATKSELTVGINGIQSQVSSKVDQSQFSTLVQQSSTDVKIAWNNITDYISIENAGMHIYNEKKQRIATFDKRGETFYVDDGTYIGTIGGRIGTVGDTNKGEKYNGLIFSLGATGHYMGFAERNVWHGDYFEGSYYATLLYVPYDNDSDAPYNNRGWHLNSTLYVHGNTIDNCTLKSATLVDPYIKCANNGTYYSGYTGTIYYVSDVTWSGSSLQVTKSPLTFSRGILLNLNNPVGSAN